MKNLLFIEGNRTKIDNSNVIEAYNKIKALGYIETMPIEYFPMEEAIGKLGGRKLLKPTIVRSRGEGNPTISNFKIKMEAVKPEEYNKFDGVCEDGQHRTLALMFDGLNDKEAKYTEITLPQDMDILTYISLRNNGKRWNNEDFYASSISTGNAHIDYILNKKKEEEYAKVAPAFLFNIYTLGTDNLTAALIKSLQQGYKKLSDYSKVQISDDTQDRGDKVLETLKSNQFLTSDRLTGRFGAGLKAFYTDCKNIDIVINVINLINKDNWEKFFTPTSGQSMEAKSFKEAFTSLSNQKE